MCNLFILRVYVTIRGRVNRGYKNGSSGYDSSDNETSRHVKLQRKYRSDPDFLSNGRGSNVSQYTTVIIILSYYYFIIR